MGRFVWIGILIAFVAGSSYILWPHIAGDIEKRNAKTSGTVHYSLLDGLGQRITQATFRDAYSLVVFGYTHCPDVCPTSLQDISDTIDLLGELKTRIVPVFITIDPARDKGPELREYVLNFHPQMRGLSGSIREIEAAAKSFRAYFKKEAVDATDPTSYLMSHSTLIYLVGPNGKGPLQTFKFGETPETMAASLRKTLL